MSMKVVIENCKLQKGKNKDGKEYYFVEVQETVRKYINQNQAKDLAVMSDVADSNYVFDELVLHARGNTLVFSTDAQVALP